MGLSNVMLAASQGKRMNKDKPKTFAPDLSIKSESQLPLKPEWPVIKTFLFLVEKLQ